MTVTLDATPTRPALRFHGAKWRLGKWTLSHLPSCDVYVEPYGGSFAVGLQLPAPLPRLMVWNDLNHDVATFFQVLRDREDELIRAIEFTPYHEAEAELAEHTAHLDDTPEGRLERARLLYVRAWQCMGGVRDTRTSSGFRFDVHPPNKTNVAQWCDHGRHLRVVAARLRQVQFHERDALWVLRRYQGPKTAYFVDPPYVESTRGDRWKSSAYSVETDATAQISLAEVLHNVEGHILLAGYPSPLYDRLYAGWRVETKSARTQAGSEALECLWIAPPLEERRQLWREKRIGRLTLNLEGVA